MPGISIDLDRQWDAIFLSGILALVDACMVDELLWLLAQLVANKQEFLKSIH